MICRVIVSHYNTHPWREEEVKDESYCTVYTPKCILNPQSPGEREKDSKTRTDVKKDGVKPKAVSVPAVNDVRHKVESRLLGHIGL